jgi:O-antigen/teichoic acid export membrane protein
VLISSIALALFVTPVVVRALASEQYGVWSFINGLMQYSDLLYLGLGAALVREVARGRANADQPAVARLLSVVTGIYGTVGVVLFAGAFVLSLFIADVFAQPLSADATRAASISCVLLGAQLFFVFVGSAFSGLLAGYDRYDLVNLVTLLGILFKAIAIPLLVPPAEDPMVTLAMLTSGTSALLTAALASIGYWYVPGMSFRPIRPTLTELRFLYAFGIQSFFLIFSVKLISYTDTTVIGVTLGASAVAVYALPMQLVEYARTGVGGVPSVLLPRLTVLVNSGDMPMVRQTLIDTMRFTTLLSGWVAATLMSIGPLFLNRWVGPQFGDPVHWVLVYLSLAAFGHVVSVLVPFPFYQALGIVGFPAAVLLCEAVLNLGLTIWLAPRIGLDGVAIATVIPAALVGFLVLPPYLCRRIGLPLRTLLASGVLPGALTLTVALGYYRLVDPYFGVDYPGLAGRVAVSAAPLMLVLLLVFPRDQQMGLRRRQTSADTLDATLRLLSGDHSDSAGVPSMAGLERVQLAKARWRALFTANQAISSALDAGHRVVVPVPLTGDNLTTRFANLLFARLHLWRAVRVLRGSGVTRTRVFAVVAGEDALFVVYELGVTAQSYAEEQIIVEPRDLTPHTRLLRALLRACTRVSLSVDLLVVVGDRG